MKNAHVAQAKNISSAMVNLPNIAIAQINVTVGDLQGNFEKIISACKKAEELNADLVAFPELVTCGYPPEDLLHRPDFIKRENEILQKIAGEIKIPAVIGALYAEGERLINAAYLVEGGAAKLVSMKKNLPNYGVFDERRYFNSGNELEVFEIKGKKYAALVCEDGWTTDRAEEAKAKGAEALISINASPYEAAKMQKRYDVFGKTAKAAGLPLIYVHLLGGQDTIVFDGGSFVLNEQGEVVASMAEFEECVEIPNKVIPRMRKTETRYQAMIMSLRDYLAKNNFKKVLLGLSGGIDSALVAVIAAEALGAENVHAVMLPSKYTSQESLDDAKELAEKLGVNYEVIDIESSIPWIHGILSNSFEGMESDTAEENIQSRLRGLVLMAISNKHGELLLTTGNKSELAVGYATLYGDMCGAFNPIKDLYKTEVYEVAEFCGKIPQNIIDKAPTAELRENQRDDDTLPPYDVLDSILMELVEERKTIDEIVADGFDLEVVKQVTDMLYKAEYKRYQSAPGPKLSATSFGKDWRYPLTNKYS